MTPEITDTAIQNAFDAFPITARDGAKELRRLIFETSGEIPGVIVIDECLKWGQPSYVSPIGSTLRIGAPKGGGFGLYAHCQSSIISQFAQTFGADFTIEGNRGVLFNTIDDIQPNKLKLLIEHALTYKKKKI